MTGQSIPDAPEPDKPAILLSPGAIRLAKDDSLDNDSLGGAADIPEALTPILAQSQAAPPKGEPPRIVMPKAQKRYFPPPPQFPAAKPKLFAATPPLAFQTAFGLVMALVAIKALRPMSGPHDIAIGLGAGLWLFCMIAYGTKLLRRAGTLSEDLRVLTGNAGLAGGLLSTAAMAVLVQPIWPSVALTLAGIALVAQLLLAGLTVRSYLGKGQGDVTPVWHLNFASFSLAGVVMADAGQSAIAHGTLIVSLTAMLVIWALSLRQLVARIPPEPLRPFLLLHALPPALLAVLGAHLGYGTFSLVMLAATLLLAVALFASLRWILKSGFGPIWAVIPAPIGAFAWALHAQVIFIGGWIAAVVALLAAVWIGYKVLKLWAANKLGPQTNAATA